MHHPHSPHFPFGALSLSSGKNISLNSRIKAAYAPVPLDPAWGGAVRFALLLMLVSSLAFPATLFGNLAMSASCLLPTLGQCLAQRFFLNLRWLWSVTGPAYDLESPLSTPVQTELLRRLSTLAPARDSGLSEARGITESRNFPCIPAGTFRALPKGVA